MSKREFVKHLESIIELLNEEKKILVENKGDALTAIIEKKALYINDLEKFRGIDLEDEKIMGLIEEIDSLQELNLLLTRQALSFQDNLLESLSKIAKNSNTYSNIGSYDKKTNINIIEKEV
ncbi:hypothetical protein [Tissierella creatinophila]|uniref:FlgN protein n=1 Tax=Tissierella creatinophila DSM 6911 TaxID=1123403 RepID=A0A1U7M2W8_TISCR|nr:hypothetical protein [Tissierella creatinophila]OLS01538.1 FlgN protein [Tissierella creatinophila DSM 6911]